jgi:hypothetical protein
LLSAFAAGFDLGVIHKRQAARLVERDDSIPEFFRQFGQKRAVKPFALFNWHDPWIISVH